MHYVHFIGHIFPFFVNLFFKWNLTTVFKSTIYNNLFSQSLNHILLLNSFTVIWSQLTLCLFITWICDKPHLSSHTTPVVCNHWCPTQAMCVFDTFCQFLLLVFIEHQAGFLQGALSLLSMAVYRHVFSSPGAHTQMCIPADRASILRALSLPYTLKWDEHRTVGQAVATCPRCHRIAITVGFLEIRFCFSFFHKVIYVKKIELLL